MRNLIARLFLAAIWTLSGFAHAEVPVDETEDKRGGGVRFHRPDGTPVYVNPRAVAFVRAPLAGEQGNATIVLTTGSKQATLETVEEVIEAIHRDMPNGRD